MWRSKAQEVVRKNGADLMSDAPAREPSLRVSSLMRSLRINALQRLSQRINNNIWAVQPRMVLTWKLQVLQSLPGKALHLSKCWQRLHCDSCL